MAARLKPYKTVLPSFEVILNHQGSVLFKLNRNSPEKDSSQTMPNKHQWSKHQPAIRQWLKEGLTGNEVAEKLAKIDFYVK